VLGCADELVHKTLWQITADGEGDEPGDVDKMSELVAAFDVVMGSDLSTRASARSWGKLALHCEIYSVTQLRRIYDVHSLELRYDPEFVFDHPDDEPEAPQRQLDLGLEQCDAIAEAPPRILPVQSHPFDSGADLKRQLEASYGEEWGLAATATERGEDRYDCLLGWEILPAVLRENPSESVS
jgi:hypothetical protein